MKKIVPFNNIVYAELLEGQTYSPPVSTGTIFIPESMNGRFIHLKILAVGKLVEGMKPGDIVLANNLFEAIDPINKNIGFINAKDILAKEVESAAQS